MAQYADYMVASEELEPGIGWNYLGWLSDLANDTGKVVRIDDGAPTPKPGAAAPSRPGLMQPPPERKPAGLLDSLTRLIPEKLSGIGALETDDIILLLILYLMYRESGDSELLIIMGAMFLL